MPTTHHIFISVRALTAQMNPSTLAAIISRLVTLTTPIQLCLVSIVSQQTRIQSQNSLYCEK